MNNPLNYTEKELAESKAAKSADEMKRFAEEEDVELSIDDLENVAGGWGEEYFPQSLHYCEHCGSRNGCTDMDDEYSISWFCYNCRRKSHDKGFRWGNPVNN